MHQWDYYKKNPVVGNCNLLTVFYFYFLQSIKICLLMFEIHTSCMHCIKPFLLCVFFCNLTVDVWHNSLEQEEIHFKEPLYCKSFLTFLYITVFSSCLLLLFAEQTILSLPFILAADDWYMYPSSRADCRINQCHLALWLQRSVTLEQPNHNVTLLK